MKKLILLMLALVIAGLALAQTDITIGTGTSTGRYPLNDYFVYSRSQCIYLESEIGAPGTIHKLRWYRNDTGADPLAIGTTQIWLKTVSNAVMTDVNWEDPGTMVAEITDIDLGAGNGWYEIDITDFAYTGGNLLVSIYTQNAPYTAPHSYWRYTATTGFNRCRLGNSDSSNPPTLSLSTARPNIQINMTAGAPSAAPNPAILAGPMNGGYAMIGDILSWNSGGGFPATYDVYFDTVDGSTLVSDNQTGLTYTPTLVAGTTYYWKVVPSNSFGDATGCPVWSFRTPGATQLAESFENTSFPPAGWANPGSWYRGTTYYKHGTAGAYKSGSTSATYVLSTPKVTITPTSTLNFWAAGSSTTTSILQIVYSADRVTWTQIGSNITPTSTYTMANYNIDLSSLAGNNYYLGFQTGSGAGTNYIDLVIGPEITPEVPGPVTLSTPADLAVNVNEYPTFTWTAPTTGGVPTGYAVYCSTSNPPNYTTDLIGSTTGALTFTATTALAYNTTYYWTVKAYNAAGDATMPTLRSFTTRANPIVSSFPYAVNFDDVAAPLLPLNWFASEAVAGASQHWKTATADASHGPSAPHSVPNFAYLYCYLASTTYNPYYLTTPPMSLGADAKRLTYWYWIGTDTVAEPLSVEISTDQATWTNLYTHSNTANTLAWYQQVVSLADYANQTVYLRFSGISNYGNGMTDLGLDDIVVETIPAAPIFSYAPTAIDFGTVMQNVAATAQNVTVTNIGGGTINLTTANISITGTDAAMFSYVATNLPAALAGGQSVTIPVTVTVTSEGAKTATLTINYNSVNYDVALSATGLPAGIVVIGNGTANNNLPINPFYGYTYSQSIFLQSEINVPDQRIESVYYYWNGVAEAVDSNDWTIYMGHTAATEFASTTDWMPLANLSQVFSGTIALPATAGWIEIPLTAPFIYNNTDNLVIAVDENAPSYDGSSQFFYSTAAATNRSLRYYSDSTNPDPAAPVAGTLVLAYPNVMLELGDIPAGPPEPVTLVSPANGITGLPATGFDLAWTPALTGGVPTSYRVYMASDEGTMLDEFSWETTNTHFNPVAEGGVTFNYLDYYYWTVKAINVNGEAIVDPAWSFEIENDPSITSFPYTQTFEANGDNTMPSGWTRSSNATGWEIGSALGSTYWTIPDHTVYAAANDDAAGSAGDGSMDLLNMPRIDFSGANAGVPVLSFDSFFTGAYHQLAYIEASTDGTTWTNLYDIPSSDAWTTQTLSLADYNGQASVYLRFHSDDAGEWASGWAIDNVSIVYSTVDTFAPVVDHYPVIGWPLPGQPVDIVVEAIDSPTLFTGIASVALNYSTDGVNFTPVPMTLTSPNIYAAQIPGQIAGTTVDYYLVATDLAPTPNVTTTATWDFEINVPVTLQYDTGIATTGLGLNSGTFGVMTGFENPFGAGNPIQINTISAGMNNAGTANVHVFTYDSVNGVLVDVIPSFAQAFEAGVYLNIPLTNCVTTDGYFYVAFTDVVGPNYFSFDQTQTYYPDTHFLFFGAGSNLADLGTVESSGFAGSWLIRAEVEPGTAALAAPVVGIESSVSGIALSWDAVDGANSYMVYGSADPYAADPWTLLDTVLTNAYVYNGTDNMKFFKVVATDATPARVASNVISAPNLTLNKKSIRSLQAIAQTHRTPKVLSIQKRNR